MKSMCIRFFKVCNVMLWTSSALDVEVIVLPESNLRSIPRGRAKCPILLLMV